MADTEQVTPPAAQTQPKEYVPLSRIDPAELAKAFEEDGVPMEKPAAAVAAEASKEAPKEAPKDEGLPTLLRLAKERDTQRKLMEQKEIDAAKPYVEALKAIPPHTAQAIAKAIQAGDPVSLLAAAGMTHAQYNNRLLGNLEREEKGPTKEEPPNEIAALKAEVEALRRDREAERQRQEMEQAQIARGRTLSQIEDLVKNDPRFPGLREANVFEAVEQEIMEYWTDPKTKGTLPGNTFEETLQLAAEMAEYNLKHTNKYDFLVWQKRKALTPATQPAVVTEKRAPESQPAAGMVANRTLTNANTTAPAVPRTIPKTRQEILQALIEGREDSLD